MPYSIEVISYDASKYQDIIDSIKLMNNGQSEFVFSVPPKRLMDACVHYKKDVSHTRTVFAELEEYRKQAKGHRPFIIAVIDSPLRSDNMGNLFGSHEADKGLAIVTMNDHARFVKPAIVYLAYYMIRYSMSFVCPHLKSHDESKSCFFDKKLRKNDIIKSLYSGKVCDDCSNAMKDSMNPEIYGAIISMIASLHSYMRIGAMPSKASGNKSQKKSNEFVTWLHLSDLHAYAAKTGWDARRILSHLTPDIVEMKVKYGLSPDLIFFTGDLAYGHFGNGKSKSIKHQFDDGHSIIEKVRKSCVPKVSKRNVFIVPGNHDIVRDKATEDQSEWLIKQRNRDGVLNMIQNGSVQWKRFMDRLEEYRKFLVRNKYGHLLQNSSQLNYLEKRVVNGLQLKIIGLNTAWSCCKDNEKGKIWSCADWQLGSLLKSQQEKCMNIILMHHPVNWFVEHEDPLLKSRLAQSSNFILHGHEHNNWVSIDSQNRNITISAASLYNMPSVENGYNYVRVNIEERYAEVWFRKFDDSGGGWIPRVIKNVTDIHGMIKIPNCF